MTLSISTYLITAVVFDHLKPSCKELYPDVMRRNVRGSGWGSVVREYC